MLRSVSKTFLFFVCVCAPEWLEKHFQRVFVLQSGNDGGPGGMLPMLRCHDSVFTVASILMTPRTAPGVTLFRCSDVRKARIVSAQNIGKQECSSSSSLVTAMTCKGLD